MALAMMGGVTNMPLSNGAVWGLHHGERQVARLTVREADFPWVRADIQTLEGFEPFEALFAEQARAADAEDWERFDACYTQVRAALTMTFPDGSPVAEFLLNVHGDGTAGWRWSDEPFEDEEG